MKITLTINHNGYRIVTPYGKYVRFLALHYTALDFVASVRALTTSAASVHCLIPASHDPSYKVAGFKGQCVFNPVAEEDRAWHTGVSDWVRHDNPSDTPIDIEIVSFTYDDDGMFTFPDYERSQISILRQLVKNILQRYPDVTLKSVVGHSNIAVGRKSDPGPKLPWKELYEAGIGTWHDDITRNRYRGGFEHDDLLSHADLLETFRLYGYALPATIDDAYSANLLCTSQMHSRPENYDDALDVETAAVLYALNEKYPA